MNPPIQFFWKKKNFTPNKNQREAILHGDGPLFLTAGPGSGKTRVLLWRTLNLLVYHNIKPEEIFLATFTEKAAHQLKEGLRTLLGLVSNETGRPFDISKMSIGTVHSICQQIISDRRFSKEAQRRRAPVVYDELSQYFHIYRNHWKTLVSKGGFENEEAAQRTINKILTSRTSSSRHNAASALISLFNRFSEESLQPKKHYGKDEDLNKLLRMYECYLESLNGNPRIKTVDFALLQQAAFECITCHAESGNVYKYIIIDEYQDTNTIQEKIFFELAKGYKNICVVGDDDQALYRFRGATVENLVEFEDRCNQYLKTAPRRIDLDTNYRSRNHIVDFYVQFMDHTDWKKEKGKKGHYRIVDKKIKAHHTEKIPSIIVSEKADAANVYAQIAKFVRDLKEKKKIQDYNQVAFLFPSLKTTRAPGLKLALESLDIPVYAPRAGNFIDVEEAVALFSLIMKIVGRPTYDPQASGGYKEFQKWMIRTEQQGDFLIREDKILKQYVDDRKQEIETVLSDYELLIKVAAKKKWDLKSPFNSQMISEFIRPADLSPKARKNISNSFFKRIIDRRNAEGNPFSIQYIISRATSLDWSVLDLFYQLNAFSHFRQMYELAEDGTDEGPICNLGLITQYLSRFMEEYGSVITAQWLSNESFSRTFFSSYLYALYRMGESEYEDADDPFPKGRVPFLTIHQAKGLEFPVVVLGSVFKKEHGASAPEIIIRDLLKKEGEPLDKIAHFDNMRMFYVALSRAKNLVVLPQYTKAAGASPVFKKIFELENLPLINHFKWSTLPIGQMEQDDLGKNYSYTADYLGYMKCPRNYMIFRKYGFVPSRSLTMFFGSLVHQTIEDLHYLLIDQRKKMVAS